MSERWPGGIVRSTPVTPTGPLQNGTAPGIWTMEQAAYWTKQGLWPTAGNFLAVEDVFSTWLYTGDGGTQTITNGINLSGQGGMVWIKSRSSAQSHIVFDTNRGVQNRLSTNFTSAQTTTSNSLTAFNSNGFSIGDFASINTSSTTYASWTFRKAPKFFDVVTYTGNGASNRAISHSLASSVGMIIIKATGATDSWWVWHRSFSTNEYIFLNQTAAKASGADTFPTTPTTTDFYVGANGANVNAQPYVAYLYAHDATSDGIIQCGSFTTDGAGAASVTLNWEPQWCLVKWSAGVDNWYIADNMRGMPAAPASNGAQLLYPNTSGAESNGGLTRPNATGFTFAGGQASTTYIYVAIRRGPMRTPTLGTSVFTPIAWSGTGSATSVTGTSYPVDMAFVKARNTNSNGPIIVDRLRSVTNTLYSPYTQAESANSYVTGSDIMNGLKVGTDLDTNMSGVTYVYEMFRRAPGFMDVVCWTNTGATQNVNHNLGVAPELIITKRRPASEGWQVYSAATGASAYLVLNTTAAPVTGNTNRWNATAPTSTVFTTGSAFNTAETYVAYLFASCPGVSKVGSYTGNGSSQTINCGFTTGARFFLVKRTDSTGNWFVWDSARGIVAGNDPYYAMNDTNGDNYLGAGDIVDADNSGIIVNQESTCNINVNAATYIYLAIS